MTLFKHRDDYGAGLIGLTILPIAILRWYAARGALGKQWGRTTSRIIAVLMIFGVPIGTLIAIYIFSQTGAKWQTPDSALPDGATAS